MAEAAAKQTTVSASEEQEQVTDVAENTTLKAPQTDDSTEEAAKVPLPEEELTETKTVIDSVAASSDDDEEVTSGLKLAAIDNNATHEITSDKNKFPDNEKKALAELKQLIQNALNNHEFTSPPAVAAAVAVAEKSPVSAEAEVEKTIEEVIKDETANDVPEQQYKINTVDEDGTKTVEAIEETVVVHHSVASASAEQETKPDCCSADARCSPLAVVTQQEVSTTPEEVSIWGVPLFKDERTDTILWKFLRARDFKVNDAFAMMKSTIKWRKEFKIDELLNEDFGDDLEKMVFMHGFSKEGHPVCYNVYGAFQDKELYQKTFSHEEKRQRFMKWRIQFLEKSIRKLDFYPGGISTIVQVNDLKNSPGPGKWELRQATKQALHLLQDNYPEFVAKQVFINVPWWYVAVNKMISPFLTQRTKSKFIVVGPSKSVETLFSYITPEQVPVRYGGFSKGEFGNKDGATQIMVKPTSKETVEFAVTEACHLTWEVRVLGWEVSYGAEFVPNAKDGYTVIIQKLRKVGPTEETIISNTFKTSEPGKVVLTIHNSSSKKKRLLYRLKSNPTFD
ncbi:patellin-3 [Beta vulgaris subsp. vulgaris]|uniref:patellin-3 n=1 Tax=Beta vulgaris subsp. vulgaris TaxID=3555 RepID=UPI00203670F8|nr:patellin-3 [Beta vulgaris subsp. vulgaris]